MGNINRQNVKMLVRIFCAESLQRIAEAMKFCWTFAIPYMKGTKHQYHIWIFEYILFWAMIYSMFT
jgi:hypothetical protein